MKYITIPILVLMVTIIHGCDNSVGPSSPKTSGEITITTQTDGYKFVGFSFSQGGNIAAPNAKKPFPISEYMFIQIRPGPFRVSY